MRLVTVRNNKVHVIWRLRNYKMLQYLWLTHSCEYQQKYYYYEQLCLTCAELCTQKSK